MSHLPSLEFYYVPEKPESAKIISFLKKHPEIMKLVKPIDLKAYYKKFRAFPDGIRKAPTMLEDHPARQKIRGIEGCESILQYLASLSQFMNQRVEKPPMANGAQRQEPEAPVRRPNEPSGPSAPPQPKTVENAVSAMGISNNPQKMSKGFGLMADDRIKSENWAKVAPPLEGAARPSSETKLPDGFTINVNDVKSTKVNSQDYISQREKLNQQLGLKR